MILMRRLLLGLFILLLLGGAALAWMSRRSFQQVPETVESGFQGEALENATLLLQKWLEADGRRAVRKGGELLAAELPEGGVVILMQVSQPITARETATLLAWVRRGGHLITDGTAGPFNDERALQALHRALGVSLVNRKPEGLNLFNTDRKQEGTDTFHPGETPYRVRRTARWRLVPDRPDDWDFRMGHEAFEVLLTRPEGEGRITLTPDLSFLYWQNLAEADHAAYFQRLLSFHPTPGSVAVWSRPVELSLFQWLWDHARLPVVGLLLLVLAWIWKGWPRFGPLRPDPPTQRRSLLEHLAASARLMWQGGGGEHLLARTRKALEQRAQRLHPAFAALDLGAKAAWLAEATGAHPDAIASALDDRPGRPPHTLAQDLLTLERLRQRL